MPLFDRITTRTMTIREPCMDAWSIPRHGVRLDHLSWGDFGGLPLVGGGGERKASSRTSRARLARIDCGARGIVDLFILGTKSSGPYARRPSIYRREGNVNWPSSGRKPLTAGRKKLESTECDQIGRAKEKNANEDDWKRKRSDSNAPANGRVASSEAE